jgi:hypothetical protein
LVILLCKAQAIASYLKGLSENMPHMQAKNTNPTPQPAKTAYGTLVLRQGRKADWRGNAARYGKSAGL